jgi:uncharacterized paraquat-inducible protein A
MDQNGDAGRRSGLQCLMQSLTRSPMPETLVACKSCENPISKKASACPSCGRRRRGEGTVALQIIVLLVLIALLVWFFIEVFANVAQS